MSSPLLARALTLLLLGSSVSREPERTDAAQLVAQSLAPMDQMSPSDMMNILQPGGGAPAEGGGTSADAPPVQTAPEGGAPSDDGIVAPAPSEGSKPPKPSFDNWFGPDALTLDAPPAPNPPRSAIAATSTPPVSASTTWSATAFPATRS